MRTISEIISNATTETEKAIQAAFWAGQSDMRGECTEQVRKSIETIKFGRYHKMQKKIIDHIVTNCGTLNVFGIDSGKGESREILDWDFDI